MNLPLILLGIILINYFPMIIFNIFSHNSVEVSNKYTLVCYIIELLVLMIFFILSFKKKNRKLNINKQIKINLILLVSTTAVLFGVQAYNFIIGSLSLMDILNIGCIFINIFFLYICMINEKVQEKNIYQFFKGILYFALIACIVNFILYYENILGIFGIGKYSRLVMNKSFFINRNQFAFIIYLAIVSNAFIIKNDKKIFYKITLVILLFSLYLTMSRTGIAIGLLLVLMLNNFKFKTKVIISIIAGVLIVSSGIFIYKYVPNVWNKINNTVLRSNELRTLSGRTRIWEKGIEVLKDNPKNVVVGVGRFNSISVLENLNGRTFSQFHNSYLDALITGGVMELLYFGFIYFSVIKRIYNSSMDKHYKQIYKAMFISYAIYISLESLGRFSIGASDTICLIFFVTIPLLHANSIKNEKEEI